MIRSKVSLMLAAGLVLCTVAAGVAPRKTSSAARSMDPFNPKRVTTARKAAVTKRVNLPKAAASVAATPAKVRPSYRPPARSPYRPPRRGPFFP
jgi:hypothetical protein